MPRRGHAPAATPASAELLRQVRRVELRTRRLVDGRFSGDYLSSFKGQGIEFAEVRPYEPGDDVRSIDWNVTARMRQPYVKRYVEERELSVLLVIDLSGSARWGTRQRLKSTLAAEVTAVLATAAVRNDDRVGMVIVTDRVEAVVPPRKGRRHVLRLLRDLLAFEPSSSATDLTPAIVHAQRTLGHRSLVFLFSDFQLGDSWDRFSASVATLATRHDVIACHLLDPADFELPAIGLIRAVDPESAEQVTFDSASIAVRERFAAMVNRDEQRARRLFARLGIDEIRLSTDRPVASALLGFFRRRERRGRR